jgi:type II secretory pathway pseudopilin PulG
MKKGLTLIEFLAVVGIIFLLLALIFPNFRFFQRETDLNNSAEEIVETLRLAQNKTLASENASQWGVSFETTSQPQQFTLFKGSSFSSRDPSFDQVHQLPKSVEIYEIDLWGGKEVVFEKVSGEASSTLPSGKVSIRLKDQPEKTRTIYIEKSGLINQTSLSSPSEENRLKDSRHVHFDYSRQISTSTESLILTFTSEASTVVQEIKISENLKNGQIYWEGEIEVGGKIQKLKIHTHRLNDPLTGTQFCIHRDRRYNDSALEVDLSGDPAPTPDLIKYTSEGQTTKGNSIYVSEPIWQ